MADRSLTDLLFEDGCVRVEGALDPEWCEDIVRARFSSEGWDDPAASPQGPVHLPATHVWELLDVAPSAAQVLDELVGGVCTTRFCGIPDNLIVNFPTPGATAQSPTRRAADPSGWHKDGDWFRHFLDSPEQGLLGIVFWRDVVEGQGPTIVAPDSIPRVARLLSERRDGIDPSELRTPVQEIVRECRDFRALTGSQGTIVYAHPFLVHAASVNASNAPRVISNTTVMLEEPMQFSRLDGRCTAVERSVLRSLGVDRLDFQPSGDRKQIVSEREERWNAT